MDTMTTGAIPAHLQIQDTATRIKIETPAESRLRCAVFVGNVLKAAQQRLEAYRLGGKLYPNKQCVPFGILSRCAITPLTEAMMSVNPEHVDKPNRQNYLSSYIAPHVWNPMTQTFEDVEVGKTGASKGLLFKKLFPEQQIASIAYVGDGAVEVGGFDTISDVTDAQYFYFPNWTRIITGAIALPPTLRELRETIGERMGKTDSAQMRGVGEVFMRGFADYAAWGKSYIDKQTKTIKDADKTPGVYQGYSEVAENLFLELELTREDKLIQNISAQMASSNAKQDEMGKGLGLIAQVLANQQMMLNQTPAAADTPKPGLSGVIDDGAVNYSSRNVEKPAAETVKQSFRVGAKVQTLDGLAGEVIDNKFGRYNVRFTDGSEAVIPVENLKAAEVEQA